MTSPSNNTHSLVRSSPPANKAGTVHFSSRDRVPANLIKTWSPWTVTKPDYLCHFNAGRKAGT